MTPSAFTWYEPQLLCDDDRFIVYGGYTALILRYRAGRGATKPYVATLCGPSGRNMLDDSPADHIHHHGIWWAHGDVNGVDYYLELPGGDGPPHRGTIEHLGWSNIVNDRPRFGFVERLAWRDHEGAVAIEEERSVMLHLVDGEHYTLDLDSTYTATADLVFGDTKESVLPGIRVAEPLTGAVGGTIVSSRGLQGEKSTFGEPAEWVDVSGPRTVQYLGESLVEGIACFDHPANPGHPQRWFTREYGPISPFEGHHFHDDRTLAAGHKLRLRHRIVVHRGDADEAAIAAKYSSYVAEEDDHG